MGSGVDVDLCKLDVEEAVAASSTSSWRPMTAKDFGLNHKHFGNNAE